MKLVADPHAQSTSARPNPSVTARILSEGLDLAASPRVPCLFCGHVTPLTVFTLSACLDGRALIYVCCPDCLDAHQIGPTKVERKRYFARRDRLLRKHLADRVLPVARALAANAEALIRKAAA